MGYVCQERESSRQFRKAVSRIAHGSPFQRHSRDTGWFHRTECSGLTATLRPYQILDLRPATVADHRDVRTAKADPQRTCHQPVRCTEDLPLWDTLTELSNTRSNCRIAPRPTSVTEYITTCSACPAPDPTDHTRTKRVPRCLCNATSDSTLCYASHTALGMGGRWTKSCDHVGAAYTCNGWVRVAR